ncbi:MAG: DUF3754 domain-containing protein [Cellvibrionaceae bacterium]|nr:DUF3754 domain-containing protein [Cellvibrionaceae bacterium]
MNTVTRFIPFDSSDIVEMCLQDTALNKEQQARFLSLFALLKRQFGLEALDSLAQIKQAYRLRDPDSDLLLPQIERRNHSHENFESRLVALLNRANFDEVSQEAIQESLGDSSIFKVHLNVDFNQYEEVLLYKRGMSVRRETLSTLFGLRKQTVEFINFDRVLIYIRMHAQEGSQPKVLLRLFQNVPRADLEMLFPETQVGLRTIDKLMIGVPAVISGAVVLSTKMGATLFLLGSMLAFYLGMRQEPVVLDKTALLAIGAGFGALGGYVWKQFTNFKNRKLKFTQALTSNLYFKLLDNNAGVFYRITDNAMEEELKEALLAFYFLQQKPTAVSAKQLDTEIQTWFAQQWHCKLDFEVDDALNKLARLKLATQHANANWQALDLSQAVDTLKNKLKDF